MAESTKLDGVAEENLRTKKDIFREAAGNGHTTCSAVSPRWVFHKSRPRSRHYGKLRCLFPRCKEQHAIAHILGTLDDKIELNRRMNETLAAMARALFKSWFMDFDPVCIKQSKNVGWVSPSGRNPPDNVDGGLRGCAANPPYELPRHIADLFPARLVDSELGELPEGWEVKTVGDLAEVVGGSTPSTKELAYWDNGCHHWATPKDLSALTVPALLDTERRVTDAGLAQISSGLLAAGTVLLSSRAPIS